MRAGLRAAGSRRRRARGASPGVDDQRRGQVAAVGVHRVAGPPVDLGRLELAVALCREQRAELPVVEGRERPRQVEARRAVRGVQDQLGEDLAVGAHQVERLEPPGRDPARRGLALADLVAVDHQDARGGAVALERSGELARHRESGETGAADQHVVVAGEGRALRSALGLALRHGCLQGTDPAVAATLSGRVPETTELLPTPKTVAGSDGLLLEIDGEIVPNYDATLVPVEEGEVVTGKVVRIDQDEVLVDIGYKSEGVILSSELSIRKSVDPADEVSLGEEVDALVLTKEDQDGRLLLSKKRARFEKAWRRIEAAAESGEPVEGHVIEVVKGGLIIDLGVRGFLPASLVDIRRVQNLDEFMGQMIECKVIELNRSRNNVVLSRRAVLEEERKEVRQQILDRLQPGQVVEGSISNIVDFGAFVDLDGIDGLIHISELSWSHVNHPSEILSIGDTVPVKVLDIDRERQRISLGLKQTQADPWQRVVDTYPLNDELEGKVTKVVTFGAFVEIMDGVEGLVHISELAHHHVENPREVVEPGDTVKVKVLEIDSERRRLSLSVKRVAGNEPPPRPAGEGGGDELGEVRDLGLSDDVFAGPDVSGFSDLRAALGQVEDAPEAPPLEQAPPAAEAGSSGGASGRPRPGRGRAQSLRPLTSGPANTSSDRPRSRTGPRSSAPPAPSVPAAARCPRPA